MPLLNSLIRALNPLHGAPETTRQAFVSWYLQAKIPQIRYVAFLTMALYLIYAAIEQNVASALAVADTVYVLDRGRVVHHSPAATLRDDAARRVALLGV